LQAIIDGIPEPILVIGRDYSILFMNHAARTASPFNEAETGNGLPCYRISQNRQNPCNSANESCPMNEVFDTGNSVKVYHYHSGSGREQEMLEVSASPLFGENGEVVWIVEILRQIPKSALAQQSTASQEQLRCIVESASDVFLTADERGMITFANRAAAAVVGYSQEELAGKSAALLIPERFRVVYFSEASALKQPAAGAMVGKTTELIGLRKDDSEFPIEFSFTSWKSKGTVYYNAIVRDITARKRHNAELQEKRQSLLKEHAVLLRVFKLVEVGKREWERTMDCMQDMVILTDLQGRVKRCNRSFKELIGRAYDELLGRDCVELLVSSGIEVAVMTLLTISLISRIR
jgi:two-component system NtrC family sensor kinase